MNITQALISVQFDALTSYSATLKIINHTPSLNLTILHDGVESLEQNTCMEFTVQDREAIVLIARQDSEIVAAGVFEVDLSLVESIGAVLSPRSISNLIVDQCEAALIRRGIAESIERVIGAMEVAR